MECCVEVVEVAEVSGMILAVSARVPHKHVPKCRTGHVVSMNNKAIHTGMNVEAIRVVAS